MEAGRGKVPCDINEFTDSVLNEALIIVLQIRRAIQLIAVIIQAYCCNQLHINIYSSPFCEH